MKYLEKRFQVPACRTRLTKDEYLLRVGAIDEKEFERRQKKTSNKK